MRIIVDADACPGRALIEKAAIERKIEVIMYCDINHALSSIYSTIKVIDSGFQSVDMKIINEVKKGDLVITQDYGVAAMVLGKKAYALSPTGYIYDDNNIERLLFERHLCAKARRGGIKTSNPKKRSIDDDERLYKNIIRLIEKNLNVTNI